MIYIHQTLLFIVFEKIFWSAATMNQYQIWVGAQGSPGGIPELESFLGALGVAFRLQDHGMASGILLAFYCFIIENNVHKDLKKKCLI